MTRRLTILIILALSAGCGPPEDRWKDFEGKRLFMRRAEMDSLVDKEGMTVACVGRAAEMALDPGYPCLRKGHHYTRREIDSLVTRERMKKECVQEANKTGFNADFVCEKEL